MRQYTTPEQTAKLIELGFEKPKMAAPALKWVDGEPTFEPQYTIGELIEMLPDYAVRIQYHPKEKWWWVGYIDDQSIPIGFFGVELCDALYEFILALKDLGRL